MNNKIGLYVVMIIFGTVLIHCKPSTNQNPVVPPPVTVLNEVDFWLTKGDQTVKLAKQNTVLGFGNTFNNYATIEVEENNIFQTIDGFGFTLTGGSATVINQLTPTVKQALLEELFGASSTAIGISYLRVSIGASDLNAAPYTYNDMPAGQTDPTLANFSLAPDQTDLIPVLKQIIQINPSIKIMASPWSPPVWMKDNNSFIGGSLLPAYYSVYAQYLVKYLQQMKMQGITIDALTPQNEPLHPGNNPSMLMTAAQQTDFIKNHLGAALQNANLQTKLVIYDHNCDRPDYPLFVLNDPLAKSFIDGTAFHLYAGDINTLSGIHQAHPDKNIYFTEQYTSSTGNFDGDLKWHLKNVIIGSTRNWSKIALEWNLANNAAFGPHTIGGCSTCKGAITITSGSSFSRNVGYYIIAHASRFIPPGSVRIASNIAGNLQNVAFKTPGGKKVLIVENDGNVTELFNIKYNGKWVVTALEAGSVGTYVW